MFVSRWRNKVKVVRADDYKGYKDANDILVNLGTAEIKNAVQNAEAPFFDCIKPLANVDYLDIMSIPQQSTGMDSVDAVLDGGFRRGQLAVLSGKRGLGKSTLASMWAVRAIDNDMKLFAYSGELPDYMFMNWMSCQVTGKFKLNQSEIDMMKKWYGDRAYIYDSNITEASGQDEQPTLLSAIETAIIQKGCEFILIDNLMTAMADDINSDLYRQQSNFVESLVRLSKAYNVFILLVAHPRKSFNKEFDNDDISGSSHITDKADLVMSLGKDKDDEAADHRTLSITKNRLSGKTAEGKHKVKIVYDSKSRRMAESTIDFFRMDFHWRTEDIYDESLNELDYVQISLDDVEDPLR